MAAASPADLAPLPHPISTQAISALIKVSSSVSGGAGNKGSQSSSALLGPGLGFPEGPQREAEGEAGRDPARGVGEDHLPLCVCMSEGPGVSEDRAPHPAPPLSPPHPPFRSLAWAPAPGLRGCYLPREGNECGRLERPLFGLGWKLAAGFGQNGFLAGGSWSVALSAHLPQTRASFKATEQAGRPAPDSCVPPCPTEELFAQDHPAAALHRNGVLAASYTRSVKGSSSHRERQKGAGEVGS